MTLLRGIFRDTSIILGQELCKTHISTTDYSKEIRTTSRTKLGLSGLKSGPSARWKPEKLKGAKFGKKGILASSRTVQGASPSKLSSDS
jgi:hypothetical protein